MKAKPAPAVYPGVLIAIDGNSLAYRAYFALPTTIVGLDGNPTNAIYGFLSMVIRVLRECRPAGMVVAFDSPWPTFRHKIFPEYKSGRFELKEELLSQMPHLRSLLSELGIQSCSAEGIEADDFLARYAARAVSAETPTVILSGDRDVFQLVKDPWVQVMFPRRGVSEYDLFSEAELTERTGVPATRYVEYLALVGDSSDNLAGIPGVGEKTAMRIIQSAASLDSLLGDSASKLGAKLKDHEARIRRNIKLMRLDGSVVNDCPVDCSIPPAARARPALFEKLGLGRLRERYLTALSLQGTLL